MIEIVAAAILLGTDVGGPIVEDTTWSAAGSPYVVQETVVVGQGATLTIEAGVTVVLDNGLGLAVGLPESGEGTLIARGLAESPIVFTSEGETPGDWNAINFDAMATDAVEIDGTHASGCLLEHVEVAFGGGGAEEASIQIRDSAPSLQNVTVHHSASCGIQLPHTFEYRGSYDWKNLSVYSNGMCGLSSLWGGEYRFENVHVYDNGTQEPSLGLGFYEPLVLVIDGGTVLDNHGRGIGFDARAGNGSDIVIWNVAFERNQPSGALRSGRTGFNIQVHSCDFVDNMTTGRGGAINGSFTVIWDCAFVRNHASGGGGALSVSGEPDLARCVFQSNTTDGIAGAYEGYVGSIEQCLFIDNRAESWGGAGYFEGGGRVRSSLFSDNHSGSLGGAAYLRGSPRFESCIFEDNTATEGGALQVQFGVDLEGTPEEFNVFRNNDASSGLGHDVRMMWESDEVLLATHVCWGPVRDESARVWDFFDDASLAVLHVTPEADCETCAADLDGDGELSIFDLLQFLVLFDGEDPRADLNGDTMFNIFDVVEYLALFEQGCQ